MDFMTNEALTPAQETQYLTAYLPLVKRVVRQLSYQTSSVLDRGHGTDRPNGVALVLASLRTSR